ncbi:alpha 1,2 mannosyltransferase [Entomortierella beljakovae]|nr:alpha 1,2 mannosyltransferase [Entomortierella beljakovae]
MLICVALTTGIPFLLLKALLGNGADRYFTSRALFLTQRLAFILVTMLIDWAVVKMARQIRRSPSIALMLISSSYVTIAYHTHPFSNTCETAILALSAVILGGIIKEYDLSVSLEKQPSEALKAQGTTTTAVTTSTKLPRAAAKPKAPRAMPAFLLGVLFSVGAFTRITFVIYGFPLGLMFLWISAKAAGTRKTLEKLGSDLSFTQLLFTKPHDWANITIKGTPTITMINNLQYNLDVNNLAEHGLHPRFFHILLNFPVLYGNLAIFGVITMFQKIRAKQWRSDASLVTDWRTKDRTELIDGIQYGINGDQIARVDRDLLRTARQQSQRQSVVFRKTGPTHFERTILVAPATVDLTDQDFYESKDSIFKHANFDHMDIILKNPTTSLFLNIYYL